MYKPKVLLINPTIQREGIELLKEKADIILAPDGKEETLIKFLSSKYNIKAVITRVETINSKILKSSQKLEVIGQHGVGVDNIDIEEATKRGIFVVNAPNSNCMSVAEHIIMLVLALSRTLIIADRAVRNGYWQYREDNIPIELNGKNFLSIGFGKIAREVAKKLKIAFNVNVITYDPYISAEEMNFLGVQRCNNLFDGLKVADYVSLHVPYNKETHHLIDKKELKVMKSNSFLINCARGKVINPNALFNALKNNSIAGAALDALYYEPPDPSDPLLKLDNIIFTPHFAGDTIEAKKRCSIELVKGVLEVLAGQIPSSLVNPKAIEYR